MVSKKSSLLFALLCLACGQASAAIYKYLDANGQTVYTSTPRKGATKLDLDDSDEQTATTKKSSKRNTPTPADFPKVDSSTQKSRDNDRRKILQDEMATEEKLLQDTRNNLQEYQTRNPGKQDEKFQALRAESTLHEKNIAALKTELDHIK